MNTFLKQISNIDYEKLTLIRFSLLYLIVATQSYIAFSLSEFKFPFFAPCILALTFFFGNLLKKTISQITAPYKSSAFTFFTFIYYLMTIGLMLYYLDSSDEKFTIISPTALMLHFSLIVIHSFLIGNNRCVHRIFFLSALFILPIAILNEVVLYFSIGIFVITTPIFLVIEKINRLQEDYYEKISVNLKHIATFILSILFITILLYSGFIYFVDGKTQIMERSPDKQPQYIELTEEKYQEIIGDLVKNVVLIIIMTVLLYLIYKQLFSRDTTKRKEPRTEPQIITSSDQTIKLPNQKKIFISEKNKIKRKIIFLYLDVVRSLKKIGVFKSFWQTPKEFSLDVSEYNQDIAQHFLNLTFLLEKCSYSDKEIHLEDYNYAQNLKRQILNLTKR